MNEAEELARFASIVQGEDGAPFDLTDSTAQRKLTRRANDCAPRDTGLLLREPEPWPERVNLGQLLESICGSLCRVLVLPAGAPEALALWAIHTYAMDAFQNTPRLALLSPVKRCGKTTALLILSHLVLRPLPASNISDASVFRAVEAYQPTIFIDEADTFTEGREELRGMLNAGHSRASAYVLRCVGQNHKPQAFSTWAAVAIARIGKLPPTLDDRAIVINLRRKTADDAVQRLSSSDIRALDEQARKARRWAADYGQALAEVDPLIPDTLDDRAADNWRPLLAIAEMAGGDWPERARDAAVKLSASRERDSNDIATMLLSDIRTIFERRGTERLTSAELCAELAELEERTWPEYRNHSPISPPQLAALLAPFSIKPATIRIPSGTKKGYLLKDFQESFKLYLE